MGRAGNFKNLGSKDNHESFEGQIGIFGGASEDITASHYYFEKNGVKIQIDGGNFQGNTSLMELRKMFDMRIHNKPDYVFVTHTHYDHSAGLPIQAQNEGFPKNSKIMTTHLNKDVLRHVLQDIFKLQYLNINKYAKKALIRSQLSKKRENYREILSIMFEKDYLDTHEMKESYFDDFQAKSNGRKDKGTGEYKKRGRKLTQVYNTIPTNYTRDKLKNELDEMDLRLELLDEYKGELSRMLYDENIIKYIIKNTNGIDYHKPLTLMKNQIQSKIQSTLLPTGHINGSCAVLFEVLDSENQVDFSLLFSGDIGRKVPTPFQEGFVLPNSKVDTLVMESTYGDKNHIVTYKEGLQNLTNTVNNSKGPMMVFAISYQKFQEILVTLLKSTNKKIHCFGQLPRIYTDIFIKNNPELYGSVQNNPRVVWESQRFEDDPMFQDPEFFGLATSGMMSASAGMIARSFCNNPNAEIVATNYQPMGTHGNRLKVKNEILNEDGSTYGVFKGKFHHIEGLSGHGDQSDILAYASGVDPDLIILTHGQSMQKNELKKKLEESGFTGKVVIPTNGDKVDMKTGEIS